MSWRWKMCLFVSCASIWYLRHWPEWTDPSVLTFIAQSPTKSMWIPMKLLCNLPKVLFSHDCQPKTSKKDSSQNVIFQSISLLSNPIFIPLLCTLVALTVDSHSELHFDQILENSTNYSECYLFLKPCKFKCLRFLQSCRWRFEMCWILRRLDW